MADKADVETTSHKIDHSVRKNILSETRTLGLEEIFYGFLIGDETEGCCEIISCIKCTSYTENAVIDKTPDWINEITETCSIVPTGLQVCGICYVSKNNQVLELSAMKEICTTVVEIENEVINKNPLLWLLNLESEDKDKAFIYSSQDKGLKETIVYLSDISDNFLSKHITLRLQHKFEVNLEESIESDIFMTLEKNVTQLCNKLPAVTFYIPECRLLIGNGVIHDEKKTCRELLEDIVDDDKGFSQGKLNKNRRSMAIKKDVLNVQVTELLSKKNESNKYNHVPVLFSQKRETSFINIGLVVDLLVMVTLNTSISQLRSFFIRGIKDQLQAILTCFEKYSKDSSLYVPKVYHFKTPQASYLTTCVYPWKEINGDIMDDSDFEIQRSNLLKKLLLPSQRPTLHPHNNYQFQDDRSQTSYLINPHQGLTNPSGAGCCVAVVDGRYSYHHYMQDNFDDNKWGCAYRSLQTICSWFKHQGYTEKPVPSHRTIQEALVAIGDKQSSFIGSKKWIGSFEVSLCLDDLLGVTSKIMAVNSGAELQSKGRELIHHFQTQGTPVMIGGGVLAHTILGVSFNDKSGEIKFLILDPHYTGGEDLKIILDKGWCGWKNHNFWNQQAHYNMCMPQRPIKI